MKTILVPVDFSKASENAMVFAAGLATKFDAKVILFNSFHSYHVNAYGSVETMDHDVELAARKSKCLLKNAWSKLPGTALVVTELVSSEHSMHDEMPVLIKKKKVDLVVMGTLGLGNKLEGLIFGTNTSWMIEKASCPVLAIPENAEHITIKHIVYASDYLPCDTDNLKTVSALAGHFNATVNLVHVSSNSDKHAEADGRDFMKEVNALPGLESAGITIVKGDNVEKALEKYLRSGEVDLLVMSAHQRSLMDKLFGKSVTRVMALYLTVPLMVFHHKRVKVA